MPPRILVFSYRFHGVVCGCLGLAGAGQCGQRGLFQMMICSAAMTPAHSKRQYQNTSSAYFHQVRTVSGRFVLRAAQSDPACASYTAMHASCRRRGQGPAPIAERFEQVQISACD